MHLKISETVKFFLPVVAACAVALVFGFAISYSDSSAAETKAVQTAAAEAAPAVLSNILDDGKSTVYISVDRYQSRAWNSVVELMEKKRRWESEFPAKKVVAMAIVTGSNSDGFHDRASTAGLLMHYEYR